MSGVWRGDCELVMWRHHGGRAYHVQLDSRGVCRVELDRLKLFFVLCVEMVGCGVGCIFEIKVQRENEKPFSKKPV